MKYLQTINCTIGDRAFVGVTASVVSDEAPGVSQRSVVQLGPEHLEKLESVMAEIAVSLGCASLQDSYERVLATLPTVS